MGGTLAEWGPWTPEGLPCLSWEESPGQLKGWSWAHARHHGKRFLREAPQEPPRTEHADGADPCTSSGQGPGREGHPRRAPACTRCVHPELLSTTDCTAGFPSPRGAPCAEPDTAQLAVVRPAKGPLPLRCPSPPDPPPGDSGQHAQGGRAGAGVPGAVREDGGPRFWGCGRPWAADASPQHLPAFPRDLALGSEDTAAAPGLSLLQTRLIRKDPTCTEIHAPSFLGDVNLGDTIQVSTAAHAHQPVWMPCPPRAWASAPPSTGSARPACRTRPRALVHRSAPRPNTTTLQFPFTPFTGSLGPARTRARRHQGQRPDCTRGLRDVHPFINTAIMATEC